MKKTTQKIPIIVQRTEAVLRTVAKPVPVEEITSLRIQKIIAEMEVALDSQDDGVAIAAPQIGVPLRIFVVSRKVEFLVRGEDITPEKLAAAKYPIYINPEIKKLSRLKKEVDEGCLSVRYLYGKVRRSEKATVTAYDENGKKFMQGGSGLLAQIFQHEVDHLNGTLFIDKAENIVEVLPERLEKNKNA